MDDDIIICPIGCNDLDQSLALIHKTIRQVNSQDYDRKQISMILRTYPREILASGIVIVAKDISADKENQIVGVAKMSLPNFLNIQTIEGIFVHPNFIRQGIGTRLLQELEVQAYLLKKTNQIFVASSLTGKDFYQALGYKYLHQDFILGDVEVIMMRKQLRKRKHSTIEKIILFAIYFSLAVIVVLVLF